MKFMIIHSRLVDKTWFESIEELDAPEPEEFRNYPDEVIVVLDPQEVEALQVFLRESYGEIPSHS